MNITGVFLREKSSNGFWVNSNKVGKDNTWPLEHNSEIYFAGLNKKVFVFMSMEATSDGFPPELTTKYTVSKVLEKGACREVRLDFRVPDWPSRLSASAQSSPPSTAATAPPRYGSFSQ